MLDIDGAYASSPMKLREDVGDTAATAEAITDVISGNEVAGSIDVSGDVDVYSFTLTDRKLVTFTEIGTTSNDILFRLVNSSDVEQAPAPTTSGGVTTLTTTLDAGTYYVKVSGTGVSTTGSPSLKLTHRSLLSQQQSRAAALLAKIPSPAQQQMKSSRVVTITIPSQPAAVMILSLVVMVAIP